MTRLIAPILSFTSDEVWQYLPKVDGRTSSVHVSLFPGIAEIVPGAVADIEADWEALLSVSELVNVQLEGLRNSKAIGKGLDAAVTVIATEGSAQAAVLLKYESALAECFNVSQATVQMVGATTDAAAVLIEAKVAEGTKCGRCWRVLSDVGVDARWPVVCARCAEALDAIGFAPMNGEAA